MSFRAYLLSITVLVTAVFDVQTFAPAQTIDFAAWKDAQNADAVPDWVQRALPRSFRDLTGTPREELLSKTLSALKEIAADSDVVPSTRYNVILAIGQLELMPGNPPVAYPNALTSLVDVYQDEDFPYYLKYGALLGIVRHTLLGLDPAKRDEVIDLLLETVATEITLRAAPLEPEVWNWFRLTALDGLTALKTVGENGRVVKELLAVINDKSQELDDLSRRQNILTREHWKQASLAIELASKAAKTLGDLDYRSATNIDITAMTDAFIALTKAVCAVTSNMAEATIEREVAPINPAMLKERIVVKVKMATHSVVWGMRGGLLTSRPSESSFYTLLEGNDPAVERLNVLMSEIVELTTFFDEGEVARRSAVAANHPKEFRFDLSDLRDALIKCSEAIDRK